jgi:hypothetical protein
VILGLKAESVVRSRRLTCLSYGRARDLFTSLILSKILDTTMMMMMVIEIIIIIINDNNNNNNNNNSIQFNSDLFTC